MRINFTQLYYILDAFFFMIHDGSNKEENDEKYMLHRINFSEIYLLFIYLF